MKRCCLTAHSVHENRGKSRCYDVTYMSRNEYSLLLRDLRSAGVITPQEFSAGYGGALPHGSILAAKAPETLPFGENKADFEELLGQYVGYCGEYLKASTENGLEKDHVQSLLSTYSHLYTLFRQIHSTRSESTAERGTPD